MPNALISGRSPFLSVLLTSSLARESLHNVKGSDTFLRFSYRLLGPSGKCVFFANKQSGCRSSQSFTRLVRIHIPVFLPDLFYLFRGRQLGFHGPVKGSGVGKIVDVGFRIHSGIDHAHKIASLQETTDLARGIIEVPEYPDPCGAGHYTGRFQASLQAALAKVAFIGDNLGRMKKACTIRAGRNAEFTGYTQ